MRKYPFYISGSRESCKAESEEGIDFRLQENHSVFALKITKSL
jgi:hypothetical protein